jgi:hypothetical protein
MNRTRTARGRLTMAVVLAGVVAVPLVGAQEEAPPPASTSAAPAKELVDLMGSRKLQAFAARDTGHAGRYVAALNTPGVQLLVVAATYGRPSDIEYRLYNKDYMGAYMDLNSGVLAKDKVFIDDALGDGLIAVPGKDQPPDQITIGTTETTFDGDFSSPRKRDKKKIDEADYMKAYQAADARYARLLGDLLTALKAVPPLGAPGNLR